MPEQEKDSLAEFKETGKGTSINFGMSNFPEASDETQEEPKETETTEEKVEDKPEAKAEEAIETVVEETQQETTETVTEEKPESAEKQETEEKPGIAEESVDPKLKRFYRKHNDGTFTLDQAAIGKSYLESEKLMHDATQKASRVQNELNEKLLQVIDKQAAPVEPDQEVEIKKLSEDVQSRIDNGDMTQGEAIIRSILHLKEEMKGDMDSREKGITAKQQYDRQMAIGRENLNYLKTQDKTFEANYDNFLEWGKTFYSSAWNPAFTNKMVTDRQLLTKVWGQYKASENPNEILNKGIAQGEASAKRKMAQSPTKASTKASPMDVPKGDPLISGLFATSGYNQRMQRAEVGNK